MAGDTIFALASAPGRAGVAVLRLSGDRSGEVLQRLSGQALPKPRYAQRVRLTSSAGELMDDGLALWFPAPRSFTGEDVVELHLHGGRAVLAAVSEELLDQGLRPAEPGEFSRRAFLNNKMDLTEAEAVADLVDAETSAQRRQALRQMDGALSRLVEDWRTRLVRALAHFEAVIDFPEEGLPEELNAQVDKVLGDLAGEISTHLADGHRGERLRDGLEVAILGAPNAGKSSLLNRLARREAAIVSATAGTTRDVIEVHLDLGGFPVVLADTAGLRETEEEIESEGIRRARARAEKADLVIAVFDGSQLPRLDPHTLELVDNKALVVVNKADLVTGGLPADLPEGRSFLLSARTGEGLDPFLLVLTETVARLLDVSAAPVLTRARHRSALEECLAALERARQAPMPELAGEDLRLAARAIGRITGRVDVEELLDVIFREFCIGK
ncbi:tRNA uridine-5-carboxymethylaminomethyl(34) synthesis GTPase MnmE [Telmatospirillum sp. J64-1]|uniref:tRNA uridine-5-carboxymethylaminomethyl(34) synthesis GTPase MnmE n=1 Tax=Telmatospirillum sp. J64-1 TaxID=2502183 RepID=UPI00115CE1E4|nr:tRNA uridine-5-carboxymethylaminomethyl(34) synthesis GTPase MnmE [Telmatospirillum sp. J64-1]